MIIDDQDQVIKFLSSPFAYGGEAAKVDRVETYISIVFLAGGLAYKLKRAVRFPYLDFSSPSLRRQACEAEVTINRRAAPKLYQGVVALTRGQDGNLRLGGEGEAVDWLVKMARFDEESLLDRMALQGKLTRRIMEDMADAIARFHEQAKALPNGDGTAPLAAVIDGNAERLADCARGILDQQKIKLLTDQSRSELSRLSPLLDQRRQEGKVRRCHGDLHLRNIFLADGVPTLFDAIEFNDAFSDIDVLYDVAFLLMDLDHREMKRLASIAFNRYLDVTGDNAGLAALPLFLSLRSAIRSHVSATAADGHSDASEASRLGGEARAYLNLAQAYLSSSPPRLIAIGGFSGTGKSRLSREMAPLLGSNLGARIVRSDALRKRLANVLLTANLGPDGYTRERSEATYKALYEETAKALASGYTVIADAAFAGQEQRQAIASVAAKAGVPFHGLWLEAGLDTRERRIGSRQRNISDITIELARQQDGYDVGDMEWPRIDSSGPKKKTLAKGLALVS